MVQNVRMNTYFDISLKTQTFQNVTYDLIAFKKSQVVNENLQITEIRWSYSEVWYLVINLMQPSKTTLNLPSSSLHLCSPLKEIRRVKIHHQFTSFPK